jgi:hypothetical protein
MVALNGLPSTTSSITSTESQDNYTATLEHALAACLTIEEAAKCLKSVLNMGPSPTVGNFNNILIGDAREDSTSVTHGSPWTPVTRNYSKHAKVKPGRPTVEPQLAY